MWQDRTIGHRLCLHLLILSSHPLAPLFIELLWFPVEVRHCSEESKPLEYPIIHLLKEFNKHLRHTRHRSEPWRDTGHEAGEGQGCPLPDRCLTSAAVPHQPCRETRWVGSDQSSDFHSVLVAASINLIKLPNWQTICSPCQTCKSMMKDEMIGISLLYTSPGVINYNSLEWHLCLGIWRQLKKLCMYCCG